MIPLPPKLSDLKAGRVLQAGLGTSTVIPDFDFETYSSAGFLWNETLQKFVSPKGSKKRGLDAVGTAVYSEHPDTEVLSCAYNLKDGKGNRLWTPAMPPPLDLLNHVCIGGILEAWNASFEYWIWNNVCVKKYGWPPLSQLQLRCAMAKSRAYGLPGGLDAASRVFHKLKGKDKRGKKLLTLFSIPRNPTKNNPHKRNHPEHDLENIQALYEYNIQDIEAEFELSTLIPDLIPSELEFWQCDQIINRRGVHMDKDAIENCISIIEQAYKKYNSELATLTNGEIKAASEVQKILKWIQKFNVRAETLDADVIEELLTHPLDPVVKRVLQIRLALGSAAVKKVYTMKNVLTSKNRIHDLFIYHSARTGRAAGAVVQPQNLPNSGMSVIKCSTENCGKYFNHHLHMCPWCGNFSRNKKREWNRDAASDAFEVISAGNLELLEYYFKNPIDTISGCLRGLFIASPGCDLICSDYSAIEAVVLAALAGEEWRMEVFRTHGKIYEMSASKITGVSFEEFKLYHATSGEHHPLRKTVGKVAELASGYQGWIGAWKQFGADKFFNDDEIKNAILAWRKASPNIVEMWGGQQKEWQSCYHGLEGAAVQSVLNPGVPYEYRGITYLTKNDVMYCKLLSGRHLTYHRPWLDPSTRRKDTLSLSFEGWNTNPKHGGKGWIRMNTYGGKLTENVVQATARDILAHAIVNLEKRGYPIVLHVHDEIVAEVPEGFGSVEELESIMMDVPHWAKDWAIRATKGWRGKRYSK